VQDDSKQVAVVVPALTAGPQGGLCARIQVAVVQLLQAHEHRAHSSHVKKVKDGCLGVGW
jgi:hypothetical protein